ncbi:14014_t:CDS:2, partial [Acaulospora colombiana]
DKTLKPIVEEYAKDEELFFKDFAAAFHKLEELGLQRTGQEKVYIFKRTTYFGSSTVRKKVSHVNSYTQPPSPNDVFLQGNAANYIEEMYNSWLKDPSSVHLSWQVYFKNIENGVNPKVAYQPPPTIVPLTGMSTSVVPVAPVSSSHVDDHMKIQLLVRAYQVRGHHIANLDPLGILNADLDSATPKELDPKHYGFVEEDLDRQFSLGPGILPGFADTVKSMTLQQKRMILDRLLWSDSFERFVSSKYPNEKRFGLEGCESLIPGMKALIDRSVDLDIESIVIGMPHRGRLNVLSNVVRKPNESIFCEFTGSLEPGDEGSGDVKYHLGMNYDRPTPSGKRVHLSLAANPSHLEAVDPVVLGKVRALQHYMNDEKERRRSMGLLIHGDAAFAAQGVVYETIGLQDLPNYTTGGTIHLVVNNQIGFTTDPRFARSTPYCTDIAKVVSAPIFHVNGDDVEAVTFVCQLAAEWRQTFGKDVVVDIVCYRKYGHNEVDMPSFTQPRMYKQIAKQTSILEKYTQKLLNDGTFSMEEIQNHKKWVWDTLTESYALSKDYKPTSREWLSSSWHGFLSPKELAEKITPSYPTGSSLELLKHVGEVISSYPKNFHVHPGLNRILKARSKNIEEEKNIDWSTAESLAFGSLLIEGKHVRLSGQDVERGTFSQRHSVLHDQENESQYVPLNDLRPGQALYTVCNSSLSEFGVLGFELGYSLVNPNSLVLWEAQFGDFSNNAQCIIDQFISSGEKKWLQRTGLRYIPDPHPETLASPEKITRHILCSGQVYYALLKARDQNKMDHVAISRLEQLTNLGARRTLKFGCVVIRGSSNTNAHESLGTS